MTTASVPGRRLDRRDPDRAKASTITPEVKEHIWTALTSLASAPVEERTPSPALRAAAIQRPETGASAVLRRRVPMAGLLDAEPNISARRSVQAFETEGCRHRRARPPSCPISSTASMTGSTDRRR